MKEKRPGNTSVPVYQVLEIMLPVCLHYIIFQLVFMVAGDGLDAGTVTTLSGTIVLGPVWFLYKRETRVEKKGSVYTLWLPFLLGIMGNFVCSAIMNGLGITTYFSNSAQDALYESIPWIQVLGLGVLVPFTEEVIFRGLVFGNLKKYYGTGAAVVFSTLIFALYHGNMIQILYALPMGLLLALVYNRWGMLWAPVLLHIGANLFGVLSSLTQ